MRTNINEKYEIAYDFYGKILEEIDADNLNERISLAIDGITLLYKRLDVKGRYRWPRNSSEVKPITWRQFDWLMSGLDIEQPKAIGNVK